MKKDSAQSNLLVGTGDEGDDNLGRDLLPLRFSQRCNFADVSVKITAPIFIVEKVNQATGKMQARKGMSQQ